MASAKSTRPASALAESEPRGSDLDRIAPTATPEAVRRQSPTAGDPAADAVGATDEQVRPENGRRSALREPFWRLVFGKGNEIIGAIVLEPDRRWRATAAGCDLGIFATEDEARDFLIARAADKPGE